MAQKSFDKLIDEISNLSLLEVSDLVKELETKFGVSAAMSMGSANAGAVSADASAAKQSASEKTEYKVTLKESGTEKIKVIKALRTVTTLGLSEAKAAVEGVPTVIGEAIAKDKAAEMKKVLEEAGAKVELS